MVDRKPEKKTGIARILAAFIYSWDGLRVAVSHEAAFRQEIWIVVISSIVLLFLPLSLLWKGLLFFSTTAILVVELLNSAIESIVDMTSPEYHLLAKHAKDLGSAAVLLSVIFSLVLWSAAIFMIIA